MSYLSRVYATSDGSTSNFNVPFSYINQADVALYLDGVASGIILTWLTTSTFSIDPALVPANGVAYSIERHTAAGALKATIQTGTIRPTDINVDNTQLLYLLQEAMDDTTFLRSQVTLGETPVVTADDISYTASGSGAVAVSLTEHERWNVNVMDYIPRNLWAAIEAGTIDVDLTSYIHKARDARATALAAVHVPAGLWLSVGSGVLIGGSSTAAHALVCLDGEFNMIPTSATAAVTSGTTTDMVTLQGLEVTVMDPYFVYGREFLPVVLKGANLFAKGKFRDTLRIKETDGLMVERLTIDHSGRDALGLVATTGKWIENCNFRQLRLVDCGHHAIYMNTPESTYINDGRWDNIEVRGFGLLSVGTFGINASTQPTQLGAALYCISKSVHNAGGMDNHEWTGFTIDAHSASSGATRPNPNAIHFADGGVIKVIEGAATSGAFKTFDRFIFNGTLRVEDVDVGGFTTGLVIGRDTGVVLNGVKVESATGGTYSQMDADFGTGGSGNEFSSANAPGAISRSVDLMYRRTGQVMVTQTITDANGEGLRSSYDTSTHIARVDSKDYVGGLFKQLNLGCSSFNLDFNSGAKAGDKAGSGTPEASVTGDFKGQRYTDNATGNLYFFKGTPTANTGWKLVTTA